MPMSYGQELILDIEKCDVSTFTRKSLTEFFVTLCDKIEMQRETLHFWDYEGQLDEYNKAPDHLKGISAVQFISTSNITIHTLDVLRVVMLNVFSCKDFNGYMVADFCANWFKGKITGRIILPRLEEYQNNKPKTCAKCKVIIYDDQWFTYSSARVGEVSPVCPDCLSKLYGSSG